MKYVSLFAGIEAASVAWMPLGWNPVAFSEIDRFACALLSHYHPSVPNLGDITKIDTIARYAPDVVVAGFPCQDLSVAGKRAGLHDENEQRTRSGLFFDALRLADDSRSRWLVMENVPGLLSSSDGRDFAIVVGEMAGVRLDVPPDGWRNAGVVAGPKGLVEWRVLDAQYFGLAQRRARVFIVRDSGDWRNRPPVLLEPESLRGDSAPGREARSGVAGCVTSGIGGGRGGVDDNNARAGHVVACPDISPALKRRDFKGPSSDGDGDGAPLIAHALTASGFDASEDGTGRGTPLVPVAFDWQSGGSKSRAGNVSVRTSALSRNQTPATLFGTQPLKPNGVRHNIGYAYADEANSIEALRTLFSEVGAEAAAQWSVGIVAALWPQEVLRSGVYGQGIRREAIPFRGLVYLSLSRKEGQNGWPVRTLWEAGCVGCPPQGWGRNEQQAEQLAAHLSILPYSPAPAQGFMHLVRLASEGSRVLREALSAIQEARRSSCIQAEPAHAHQVRRLMVEECEALQGFPRGYSQIQINGKPAADGPRYAALGNSMAVPVVRWIGERIAFVDRITPTPTHSAGGPA